MDSPVPAHQSEPRPSETGAEAGRKNWRGGKRALTLPPLAGGQGPGCPPGAANWSKTAPRMGPRRMHAFPNFLPRPRERTAGRDLGGRALSAQLRTGKGDEVPRFSGLELIPQQRRSWWQAGSRSNTTASSVAPTASAAGNKLISQRRGRRGRESRAQAADGLRPGLPFQSSMTGEQAAARTRCGFRWWSRPPPRAIPRDSRPPPRASARSFDNGWLRCM